MEQNDDLDETIALLQLRSLGSILITDANNKLLDMLYPDEAELFRGAYGEEDESCCCGD